MSNRCTGFDSRYDYPVELLFGFSKEELQLELKKGDPTDNMCYYVEWIYKQYYNRQITLGDIEDLRMYLEMYHTSKHRFQGKNKDINTFTYSTLIVFLESMFDVTLVDKEIKDDIIVMYSGPLGTLSTPTSADGSSILGRGTQWCTTGESSMYNFYGHRGSLYVWVDNNWNKGILKSLGNRSKKFQFHFESGEFRNENDMDISKELMDYFRTEHPILKQLYKRYEDKLTNIGDIVNYVHSIDSDNKYGYITKYILGNEEAFLLYFDRIKDRGRNAIEDKMVDLVFGKFDANTPIDVYLSYYNRFPDTIVNYIVKYNSSNVSVIYEFAMLRTKSWDSMGRPELDSLILSRPEYAMNYILGIKELKLRSPIETDNIILRALINREPNLSIDELYNLDKRVAGYYAINVLRTRTPSIELGTFGSDILDEQYYKLFLKSGKPNSISKLCKENANMVDEEYFMSLTKTDVPTWELGNMFEFYREYVRLFSRSNIIEDYLYDNVQEYSDVLIQLSLHVFNKRLVKMESEVLEHSQPSNINLYMSIFIDKKTKHITDNFSDLLLFTKFNGQTNANLTLLMNSASKFDSMNTLNITDLSFLTLDSIKYMFANAKNNVIKCLMYTIGSIVRNEGIEKIMGMYSSRSLILIHQLYWNKFLSRIKMDKFEEYDELHVRLGTYRTYWKYYKGDIGSIERYYILPVEYLMTRVRG